MSIEVLPDPPVAVHSPPPQQIRALKMQSKFAWVHFAVVAQCQQYELYETLRVTPFRLASSENEIWDEDIIDCLNVFTASLPTC
ncbi:unnamed protein product [Toxocara canis]|uniref:Uncharacterized protein n=1 Tax=Toxocara canis TaxID=6265 RepID=A0A183UJD3_TOXCA|nr:unnamed protein product [Toxocara canis]